MILEFFKRMDVKPESIFYSIIKNNNDIIAFGREHYSKRVINEIQLDKNFNIKKNIRTFKGEDPRCFYYNDNIYIQDNYLNDMYLINYNSHKYTKINIKGKNISFITHKNTLYFIHYIKPFNLYSLDIESGIITKVEVNDDMKKYNYEYRGGTPGYILNETTYYGFGHRTYHDKNCLKHDIFLWLLFFDDNKKPRILHIDIEQPINSKNICDPTSVITIENKTYLITAETDNPWFLGRNRDYITNIYIMDIYPVIVIGNILCFSQGSTSTANPENINITKKYNKKRKTDRKTRRK